MAVSPGGASFSSVSAESRPQNSADRRNPAQIIAVKSAKVTSISLGSLGGRESIKLGSRD
jgi:hypothetical protein